MDLSATQRQRLHELVREAKEIAGGCLHADGRPKTFAELEDESIELGDLITAELLEKRVQERAPQAPSALCPGCGREGERQPEEPHVLQTDRGQIGWMEPAYYCPRCRQAFFPSHG